MVKQQTLREELVEGVVEEVSYRSDDGRFSVLRLSRDPNKPFTAVGELGLSSVGETLRLRGRWKEHKSFGAQFRVTSFTPVVPTSAQGIVRYLGSGLIPGIGKRLAERLVERFGLRTLDVIVGQSKKLREVEGIGKRRAEAISEAVRSRRDEAETLSFLHSVGLGPAMARKLLDSLGHDAARLLRDDPYLVAERFPGLGFRTADNIGRAVGIGVDDPRRAAGAALHVLARGADSGHVYLSEDELVDQCFSLEIPRARVLEVLPALEEQRLLVREEDRLYPPPLHRAETRVAAHLHELSRPRKHKDTSVAEKAIEAFPLSATQREAVIASLNHGLMVLTGGPGTGKTTTVKAIVAAQQALGRRIFLAAPTGRAAKRLAEATGSEARTLHRMLEWTPATGGFRKDASDPLDAEVILVDEASMLNLQLADHLLQAVAPSSRLIFVGDVDQLPPVGAGHVLRDVIASEQGHLVRLQEVFRQAQESAIVRGAHAILRGDLPEPTAPHTKGTGDLFFVKARDPEKIAQRLLEIMSRVAKSYGLDPRNDVQVLVPMRRGSLGTERLNVLLQKAMNPNANPERPGSLQPGDKVMQLKNDYDRDVFNGDLGTVRRVDGGITYIEVDGREVKYPIDDLDALTLAYASTVHKVQGSEFPAVVVLLHGSHHVLLSRALIYTAVTRAKGLAVLLGDPSAFQKAVRNADAYDVNSTLAGRLRAKAEQRF